MPSQPRATKPRLATRALQALAAAQRPDGHWPLLSARQPTMEDAWSYRLSPYPTGYILDCLAFRPRRAAAPLIAAAAAALQACQNDDGSWSYEGRATRRVPADLDDTAVAVAALVRAGQPVPLRFFSLLWRNEAVPGGPYYTWIGINRTEHRLARELDALVNANICYAAALARIALPGLVEWLRELIITRGYRSASAYCHEPDLLLYALARVVTLVPELADLREQVRADLADLPKGAPTSAFAAAARAAGLARLGAPRRERARLLAVVAARQLAAGGWPAEPIYRDYPPYFAAAPALTAALAYEGSCPHPAVEAGASFREA